MPLKDFQFLGKLGEGAYSSVYKAKRLIDNQIYAIKKVKLNNLNERQKENALNQVRILASIHHPNIISYKESFIEQSSNFLYIIMQFADNGDLYEKINTHTKNGTKFTQEQVWSIIIQITRGLKALHDLTILHRDLKTANVFLFQNGAVKLGDMNVSKLSKNMCKTQTGTPYYASPEVWKDLPYDKKSDIWSLGCVIYEAITLKPPFRANDMQGLYKKVVRGFYPHIPQQYSEEINLVLKNMLQVTPHMRSNCDRILQLPIVAKHITALPESMQNQQKAQNKLLQTIRLKVDSKDQLSINMPKPRYMSTFQYSQRLKKPIYEKKQDTTKDFHNVSLKKELNLQNYRLPKIKDTNYRSQKVHSQIATDRDLEGDGVLISLNSIETTKDQGQKRRKGRISKEKKLIDSNSKLPLILHGRLRHMSPEAILRALQKQKQKQKILSIIGKN